MLRGGQHGAGRRGDLAACSVLGEGDQVEGVFVVIEVGHLTGHALENVRAHRPVSALGRRVEGGDEEALGALVHACVEAHPAGDAAKIGDGGEEGAAGGFGVGAGIEQGVRRGHLGDDGGPGEGTAVAVVRVAEHAGDGPDVLDLPHAHPAGRSLLGRAFGQR